MEVRELFLGCRRGDTKKIKYLVEQKEVDLNLRDKWDSTPLYYACLCGHVELVKYLLENGARCEANTFDGERCLYGALNNEIRKLLLNYKIITSRTIRRDNFEEFLRKLFETGDYSDVTFIVHGQVFSAHKCILAARSEYFCDAFQSKWKNRQVVTINNKLVPPSAFKAILQFLYTARLDCPIEQVDDCIRLAVQCKLPYLKTHLEDVIKKATSFECTKPGTHVTMLLVESADLTQDLQQDLGIMAEQACPPELDRWVLGTELPLMPRVPTTLVDICFEVEGHRFLCHKVFFGGRSEYFRALLRDHFGETWKPDDTDEVDVVYVRDIAADVFVHVLHYVYTNTSKLNEEVVYEVLQAADRYLLPGLKRICGNFMIGIVNSENVIDVVYLARTFELPRLENHCMEYIAIRLEELYESEGLRRLIMEDAAEVKGRQETDTIPAVDDVRYHISAVFQDSLEALKKHALIDKLLEEIGLEA